MTERGPIIEAIQYRVIRLRRIPRRSLTTRVAIEIVGIVYATAAVLAVLIVIAGRTIGGS